MKKAISALLALCLTFVIGAPALADEQDTYVAAEVTFSYMVTVPAQIDLTYGNTDAAAYSITASDVSLPSGNRVIVTAVGDGAGGAFSITNGTDTVAYGLSTSDGGAAIPSGGEIANFAADGTSPFWIKVPGWAAAQTAGTYKGNITFTIDQQFYTTPTVMAGFAYATALKSDGTVWTWFNSSTAPTAKIVNGISDVTAVAGEGYDTIALTSDGTVWQWDNGSNPTAVQVNGLSNITAVAAGQYHHLALDADGTVWAWGVGNGAWGPNAPDYNNVGNEFGQLGDGTLIDRTTPAPVIGLSHVTAIAAGQMHSFATESDGSVWAWGWNNNGQLGDAAITDLYITIPVEITALQDTTPVTGGLDFSLALKPDGTVLAWGDNSCGQLGTGGGYTPAPVSGLSAIAVASAGMRHGVALTSDGTVLTWGSNQNGQLGDGTTDNSPIPQRVTGQTGVAAVSAGAYQTVTLKSDGTIWMWGIYSSYTPTQPVQVIFP